LAEGATAWITGSNNTVNTPVVSFSSVGIVSGDFTAGKNNGFNNLTVYYSRVADGNWSDKNSWSTIAYGGSAANKTPNTYDIVKIGYHGSPGSIIRHRITLNTGTSANPVEIATLVLEQNPETNGIEGDMSRLIIPPNRGLRVNGKITGNGEIQYQMDESNTPLLEGDLGDFVTNPEASFIMRSNSGNVIAPAHLNRFPRLSVPGSSPDWSDGNSVTFATDITCINLNIRYGGTLRLNNGLNGDIHVLDSLRVGGIGTDNSGRIVFPNNGNVRTLRVGGDIALHTDGTDFKNNQIYVEAGGSDNLEHRLIAYGNIMLRDADSYLNLFTANDGLQSNVILELSGDESASFTSSASSQPSLYRVVLNKQTNRNFTFNNSFTLNGPTDGEIKALELVGGTLNLSNSGIDLMLTSGGSDFKIPAGTGLFLGSSATVRVSGDNTGIWLDGTITGGYNTNFYLNGGINNYIEYTSSGSSKIILHQTNFYVGSQIRRSELAEEGILDFSQNHVNSTVKIGTHAHLGGATNRGVFEMVSPGSSFFQAAGARMSIVNAVPNSTVPSLNINLPDGEVNLENGSIIAFGDVETQADQSFGLFSSVKLMDLHVDNQSGNTPIVNMKVVAAAVDNVTIDTGATLMANGLDLTVAGDWLNSGNYISEQNTTTFSGVVDQNISGNSSFYNLVKTGASDFILAEANADILVDNMFVFESGQLHGNNNVLLIKGDLSFSGLYLHSGTSKGIVMGGAETQRLTGNGVFGMLTISNLSGVDVPVGNQLTVNNRLRLEQGVLNIGSNLLVLGVDSEIEAGNPFSVTNMIQTNISFTDNGVKKYIPSGAVSFVFPMGSAGKYTPVTFEISGNTNTTGSLLAKPAGEYHPSVLDPNNVLHYHWVLRADGLSGFNGTARMRYYPVDVKPDPANISNYVAARLLSDGSGEWNKFSGEEVIDIPNNQLVFTFIDADDNSISGDYTAGLDEAIPDQVPTYISKLSGSWNDVSTWDTYPVAGGVVPGGGPRGSMVIVAHNVDVPANFISSYRTTILENGNLELGSTFGHRLGDVLGNGKLTIDRGDLPAGVYDEFFSANGGTLEFKGNSDYDILSDITQVNHLKVSGLGARRLPNLSLQLLGDLTIDGGVNLKNEHYQVLSVKGDVNFISGSFNAGFGVNAKVIFNGSQFQTVAGIQSFTGDNKFHRLSVNNSEGVLFITNADVAEVLTLTSGRLVVNDGTGFSILNSSAAAIVGASATRYIDGPLYKRINSGASFEFPLGNESRYGKITVTNVSASGMWRAQYYSSSPSGAGLSTGSKELPVQYVSSNEYWNIEAPAAATAEVTLRWDASSGVNPAESGLRGVQWLADKWYEVTLSNLTGSSTSGTAKTSSFLNFNANTGGNYITFGAITIPAYTWTGDTSTDWFTASNWTNSTVPSASANTTIGAVTNLPEIAGAGVAQVNNLVIETGAILTLNPGGKLTVNGDLAIADVGGLIMKNTTDINGLASLMTNGSISGEARIELKFPYDEWYYVSQPIANAKSDIYAILNGDNSFSTSEAWINVHRANRWYRIGTGVNLGLMEGVSNKYRPADLSDHVVSYTGALNNGAVARSFSQAQYYLLGNPYPSAINWQSDAGWERNDIGGTIWYRTRVNNEMAFVTYNRFAEPGARAAIYPDQGTFGDEEMLAYIPPLQSVWISSLGSSSVGITNEARSHAPAGTFLKSSSSAGTTGNVIRIIAENASSYDGAVLYFSENSEEGIDRGDSEKMFNESVSIPEVYTRVNDKAMAINGLPLITESSRTIPLSVRNRQEGEVALRFDLQYYSGAHAPYLEDRETGAFINLLQEPDYTYTVGEPGDKHDRFALHFYYVTTDLESPKEDETDAGSSIKIKSIAGKVLVSVGTELLQDGEGVVEIYTIEGRKISEVPARTTRTLVILPNESGVYIIRAKFGSQVKSEQVIGVMK